MTRSRSHVLRAWPALLLFAGACGKDAVTTPTDATVTTATATVTLVASPETVVVTASPDTAYAWSGSFVATLTNADSTALTVNSISSDLQQSSAGVVIVPAEGTDESFRFDVRAPGNRVDVNGTLAVPFTFHYTLPNGGREALINLSFVVRTDGGAAGAVTATVNFQ